ncbi:transposase [Streptomyces noursei]|uniref:transposase n=1 Tax=Streptomyces noursei TaxID=1971 RepID=UPI0033F9BE13
MTALVDEHPRLGVECVLRELHIPSSAYYRWRRAEREPCERRRRDTELTEQIRTIHADSGGIYGSPRMHAVLKREGVAVGCKRVERLASDLVNRDFTAPAPNRLWATDLTMIPTLEGPLWLSAIRDAFSRRVVAWETFQDEKFKEAFGVRGRRGISPGRLALISILQFAENLTDRQAAHAVRARIDVKYLLGLELTDPGFHHTVLTGFRDRLLAHGLEEKILDLLLERLGRMGLVVSGGRQRTDSTHVLAAVRTLNRLEFVGETLRATLEALTAAAPDWMRASMDPQWQERYGTRVDAYRLPADEQERRDLAGQIAADGYHLLEVVFAPAAPAWLREVPVVGVLRTVWVQQFTRTVTDGAQEVDWRGKDDLPPSRVLIASPYDPEARYAKKR